MTTTITNAGPRSSTSARRVGYVVAAFVNLAILVAANLWPGWRAVPFLTDETTAVLGLFNFSLVVGTIANVLYALVDAAWLRALGEVATTVIGLAVLARIWRVFPFDFPATSTWTYLTRFVLVVGMVGAGIGLLVNVVALVRQSVAKRP